MEITFEIVVIIVFFIIVTLVIFAYLTGGLGSIMKWVIGG